MLYIFDWDGTLCHSLDHIEQSIHHAARQTGLPEHSAERARSVIGLGLQEALTDLYPSADEAQRGALVEHYRQRYLELDRTNPAPFFEGVEDTLSGLLDRGHELAVATGKNRVGLDRVLNNLGAGHFFVTTRCADEARSKPHPLMLEQILESTGYEAGEAVMIGDTDFDLMMAVAAGIQAVGATYGAHPVERLRACNPGYLIGNIRELQNLEF